jgi:hypothetical protein
MKVYFKRGEQTEEGAELYREYERDFGRRPFRRDEVDFLRIEKLGLTITAVGPGWWEDRLRERGWAGLDADLWMRFFAWVQKPGNEERLRPFLSNA